jgi:hypothetical protein
LLILHGFRTGCSHARKQREDQGKISALAGSLTSR